VWRSFRLDAALVAEVRQHTDNLTGTVEDGLRLWLERRQGVAKIEKAAPDD